MFNLKVQKVWASYPFAHGSYSIRNNRGGVYAPPGSGRVNRDAISEENNSNLSVSSLFNAIFWHNVHFMPTIFQKYADWRKIEKRSILSLCNGDFSIFNFFQLW
jgi:hypothetical protein